MDCTQFVRMCHLRRRVRHVEAPALDREVELLVATINRQLAAVRERELDLAESVR